jgi:hypothetical protein
MGINPTHILELLLMQTPYSPLGLRDLPVKDLQFFEPNWLFETLMVSLVIKHRPFKSFGVGSMMLATSSFAFSNCQSLGVKSSSVSPFPYVTSGYVLT